MSKFSCFSAMMLVASLVSAQPPLRLKPLSASHAYPAGEYEGPVKTRTPGRSHVLVQFADGPSKDQIAELSNRGATVLSYVPDFGLSLAADDGLDLAGLDVQWVGRLSPDEKISPLLTGEVSGTTTTALVEFYSDVGRDDARTIANSEGLVIRENPDLLPANLMVQGSGNQILALSKWDEVSYIFPASRDLVRGRAVRPCAGGLTSQGPVTQAVALVNQGWAPGAGSANLKYAFVQMTQQLPTDATQTQIVNAFNEWAKYAQLTFTQTSDSTADETIAVLFASGAHGDNYPFTGPGGVLAHTFYPPPNNPEPIAGDMHFNNDETWKIGADEDVFSIALHETGHALGLGHSDNPDDVMYPYYSMHSGLSQGDISAILQLYAAQNGTVSPTQSTPAPAPSTPTPAPQNPLVLLVQAPASTTTASSIAVTGTTSGGSGAVQVIWSTNQGASGVAQGTSQWTITAVPLGIGANVITIQATDSQQNRAIQMITVTCQQVAQPNPPPANPPTTNPSPGSPTQPSPTPTPGPDTTPPSLTILTPASTNVATSATSLVVSGTASDNIGVSQVTWSSSTGGSGTATGTNQWTTPPIPIYVGATTIIIRAYDAAGNTSWRSLTATRQ